MTRTKRESNPNSLYKTGSQMIVWIRDEMREQLVEIAQDSNQFLSEVVRQIIEDYLNNRKESN